MNDRRWKVLANVMIWARRNAETLAESEVLLPTSWKESGTPLFTKEGVMPREPYGYSHWNAGRGLIFLRNPWMLPVKITVPLEGEAPLNAVSLYPETRRYGTAIAARAPWEVTLAPYETLVLSLSTEAIPEDLPHATESVASQLTARVQFKGLVRLEYEFKEPRLAPSHTVLVDESAKAVQLSMEAEVESHAEKTQLLLLLEGAKTPRKPETTLIINGKPISLSLISDDGGFAASGLTQPEHWAFYGADLPQGESALSLQATSAGHCDRLSLWVFATKAGGADSSHPNALPSPEVLYLDAVPLLNTVEVNDIAETRKEAAPVERIDGVYLDALEPESVVQGWRELERNQSVWKRPMRIAGQPFMRGLGTHAPSTITYLLDGSYKRFQALAGQDDEVNGSVTFQVLVDGEIRWESGVMRRGDPAKAVDVDLSGASKLELIVGDAEDNIMADHANWADAKFIR
jgi:hypothetical protein